MYPELVLVFSAKRSEVALIQSIYMLLLCAAGIFFTGCIKKFGPGNSMIFGSIVGWLGLFVAAFVNQLNGIVVTAGFVASIGMGICYLSPFVSINWIFHENPGIFLTVYDVVIISVGSR